MGALDTLFGSRSAVLGEPRFLLLLLANAAYPLGTVYLSPILESLVGPFGVGTEQIGLLITAFFAPSIVITPFAGTAADRIGRKPVLVGSLLVFGLAGVAIAGTTDFRVALGLRLLQGVGAAGILPVVVASITDLFDGTAEATAQGLRGSFHSLVGAVLPVLAGLLVVVHWRYPFLVYGAAVPIALVLAVIFEEPTATEPAVTDGGGPDPSLSAVVAHCRSPAVLALLVGIVVPPFLFLAFITYNSFIVVTGLGGSPGDAGVLAAIGALSSAAASSQAGRIDEWFASRTVPLVALNLGMLAGLATIALAPSVAVAAVGAVPIGIGFGLLLTFYRSTIAVTAPTHLRGSLVGLGEAARSTGATLPPVVMGVLIVVVRPTLGPVGAVRWVGVGVAIVGGLLGVACVLVARERLQGDVLAAAGD